MPGLATQEMVHNGPVVIDDIEKVLPPVRGIGYDELTDGIPDKGAITPDFKAINGIDFIAVALSWLGTPYRAGGFSRSGVDCSGFLSNVLMATMPELGPFPRKSEDYASWGYKAEAMEPGDILLFAWGGNIYHVGIALSDSTFIHAASEGAKTGVIISSLWEGHWRTRLCGVRQPYPDDEKPQPATP
ncbi:MAG: C40 family peptidase [Spirochaetaceae bacterium]|nr:C40 family peptidase [Spirochaetaceae bacterium]